MGHSALYTMCQIVQTPRLLPDANLIRGALFFIHLALWGDAPLPNLHCPPTSVLPSFLHVSNLFSSCCFHYSIWDSFITSCQYIPAPFLQTRRIYLIDQ